MVKSGYNSVYIFHMLRLIVRCPSCAILVPLAPTSRINLASEDRRPGHRIAVEVAVDVGGIAGVCRLESAGNLNRW